MVRKQVFLTDEEGDALAALAQARKKKQSELIREAVERLLEQSSREQREAALKGVIGMWKDRTDLPDFDALRAEWDRR